MTRKLMLAAALALALPGCTTLSALPADEPAAVADRTILDERAAMAAELAYQAAVLAAVTAADAGFMTGDQRQAAHTYERRAYSALQAVRRAYDAGNAKSYAVALDEARAAIADILKTIKGA